MTNSSGPQFPQVQQYQSDAAQSRNARSPQVTIGTLERAPEEVRAQAIERAQEIRIQGEVARVARDGVVRLTTSSGEVDVRLPPDQPRPRVGQSVEVLVSPPPQNGNASAQVEIRVTQNTSSESVPARDISTPVQVEVRNAQNQSTVERASIQPPDPNAPAPVNRFPEIGSLVRLEPLSPQQFQRLSDTGQLIVLDSQTSTLSHASGSSFLAATTASNPSIVTNVPQQDNGVLTQQALTTSSPYAVSSSSTSNTVSLESVTTRLIGVSGDSQNSLNVPILNRSQAAVAQLQNAAINNTGVSSSQDIRVNAIQTPIAHLGNNISHGNAPLNVQSNSVINNQQRAAQLSGQVIAKTNTQIPIVQFSVPQNGLTALSFSASQNTAQQQVFALQFPSDALLLGSTLTVTPQASLDSSISTSQNIIPQALPQLAFANIANVAPWQAMQDIQQTLLQASVQNAAPTAQAFSNIIPSPSNAAQFGPAALLFIAAVRGGDISSWLSDKTSEILKSQGKGSLLSRLSSEAAGASRMGETPSAEWRGMNIPLLWDGDIQKIALHYRHESDDSQDQNQDKGNVGTRFIFDLNLDAMGQVQLDGLFRPISSDGPRLDIVLRTEEPFSTAMQAEMRRIYMDAIKPSQIGGELSFQNGLDAWLMINAQDDPALGVSA
ncbi:MAG: hypothetical protein AB8B83_03425 [Bdellovibrionales bacterium]